ncbi:YhfC family intramembrane metalloprotease [Irregularibacter muris]|uniref:YhfC family intramembrane metalloprotease n=1 Tax=Irregularibacter muris TaxID=1796619 RepID=A0AAE3HJ70_9FIRM|nr:YhfC family intramembrane metalloprotease [Irregularibacter muris]MCR1899678.1 YhfC family intramembrane metalloprotease [Irregularibacter muris]
MSILVMISVFITIVISIVLPIIVVWRLYRRDRKTLKWALVGGLTFFITQILIRIPALNYLNFRPWYIVHIASNTWILGLFLGFTAALFEEGGRFLAMRTLLRERITWFKGFAFGVGHGGIEAILLVGVPYIKECITQFTTGTSTLQMLSYKNILLAGVERLLAMTIHVGLTFLVLYGIKKKKIIYFLYALVAHTLVDAPILWIRNPLFLWGYLVLWTIILLVTTLSFKGKFDENLFI